MGSTQTSIRNDDKLKEPEQYGVVLLNDDYTTMEFVVEILITVFHKEEAEAARIMLDVHHQGRGMAGLYTFDIAVTKAEQVHSLARQHEFPLRCLVERA
ncbi:MAG: ATP-dependent Clp protease adapter ClpS [Spirochaetaceae bacterium]|jgi:ATP-dependent Clp protease adaptor protein ClpS|nr:ATP-dependent Clp protease adapter ClpS [Spirochaetaceae bacterium]